MDTKQLDELLAMHGKATPLPWTDAGNKIGADGSGIAEVDFDRPEDLSLVVAMRNALPSLISQAREAIALRAKQERVFPLQRDRGVKPGPLSIPWSIGEKAWQAYTVKFHNDQTCEIIARRGGFSWGEMDTFYPQWREEIDDLAALRSENERLRAEVERVREALTPSYATEKAYIGDPNFLHGADDPVPWATVKDLMATILKRAALAPTPEVQR